MRTDCVFRPLAAALLLSVALVSHEAVAQSSGGSSGGSTSGGAGIGGTSSGSFTGRSTGRSTLRAAPTPPDAGKDGSTNVQVPRAQQAQPGTTSGGAANPTSTVDRGAAPRGATAGSSGDRDSSGRSGSRGPVQLLDQPGSSPAQSPSSGQATPPINDNAASSGGSARSNGVGGGGETLADCMNFWDPGTHMTKAQWRETCKRTLNRLSELRQNSGLSPATSGRETPAGRRSRSR